MEVADAKGMEIGALNCSRQADWAREAVSEWFIIM
jgi:hypothetical protein